MHVPSDEKLEVATDSVTRLVNSVKLYGVELLDNATVGPELLVNGLPLKTRAFPDAAQNAEPDPHRARLKGERFTDHFSGWSLVINRNMGHRAYAKFPCFGVQHVIRREQASMIDLPCPGPGGPVIEAPLFIDSLSLMNWNWKFWGADTRMIFPSLHSSGPSDEFGHVGYENDTPEIAKSFMRNVWRRIYPGVMAIHGGLFYDVKSENWLAITCRRPNVGYILNIEDAGRGVGYDFTLHAPFGLGESLVMPEVKIYFGKTADEMWQWAADYITFYYEEPPQWLHKTVWGHGLSWNNKPSWTEQAQEWQQQIDDGIGSGIGYSLVTNRPVISGTDPMGYEPDPNHGTRAEFKAMCRTLADKGTPLLVWMSYSGLMPGGDGIEDDWFIRGIDGRLCAAWGSEDLPSIAHCNPGHPGYIEYTKKWIRYYMNECGVRGIFFDCAGWAFPPDYTPRSFMRFPGDTNRMGVRFFEEIYACIKECDPDGVMLGEGTTLEGPINVFSVNSNPSRAVDGMGPRDFLLWLNQFSQKRMVIDQGSPFNPSAGMIVIDPREGSNARNRALTALVASHGGRTAFLPVPGDFSIMPELGLLIAPAAEGEHDATPAQVLRLPDPWAGIRTLTDTVDGSVHSAHADGSFGPLPAGIYTMAPYTAP